MPRSGQWHGPHTLSNAIPSYQPCNNGNGANGRMAYCGGTNKGVDAMDKRGMYKTAIARISRADFEAGDFVSVEYSHMAENGTHWYRVTAGGCLSGRFVMYPEHHLTYFVL